LNFAITFRKLPDLAFHLPYISLPDSLGKTELSGLLGYPEEEMALLWTMAAP
jgi:hypothetical protein